MTGHYGTHIGRILAFGYPLARLVALMECGTRAALVASFGPDSTGELAYARRLLKRLDTSMFLLANAYYDAFDFLQGGGRHTAGRRGRRRPGQGGAQ